MAPVWAYGSATLPGTSHYLDRIKGMLTLRGVRGVTSPSELVSEQGLLGSFWSKLGVIRSDDFGVDSYGDLCAMRTLDCLFVIVE